MVRRKKRGKESGIPLFRVLFKGLKKKEEYKIQVTGYIKKKPQKLWFFLVSDFDTQLERICFLTLHTGLDQILCRNPIEKGCCCDNIFFFLSLFSPLPFFLLCQYCGHLLSRQEARKKNSRDQFEFFCFLIVCVCESLWCGFGEQRPLYKTSSRTQRNDKRYWSCVCSILYIYTCNASVVSSVLHYVRLGSFIIASKKNPSFIVHCCIALHCTAYTQSHEGVPLALLKGVSFFFDQSGSRDTFGKHANVFRSRRSRCSCINNGGISSSRWGASQQPMTCYRGAEGVVFVFPFIEIYSCPTHYYRW